MPYNLRMRAQSLNYFSSGVLVLNGGLVVYCEFPEDPLVAALICRLA